MKPSNEARKALIRARNAIATAIVYLDMIEAREAQDILNASNDKKRENRAEQRARNEAQDLLNANNDKKRHQRERNPTE